jgi:hypothetical protein
MPSHVSIALLTVDQAKNACPSFTTRPPKDFDPKNMLPLHIVGVIVSKYCSNSSCSPDSPFFGACTQLHGTPDKRYLFGAGAQLAGNTALNVECIRRALVKHCQERGFRRKLHVQVDNASDNKSRWMCKLLLPLPHYHAISCYLATTLVKRHTWFSSACGVLVVTQLAC